MKELLSIRSLAKECATTDTRIRRLIASKILVPDLETHNEKLFLISRIPEIRELLKSIDAPKQPVQ